MQPDARSLFACSRVALLAFLLVATAAVPPRAPRRSISAAQITYSATASALDALKWPSRPSDTRARP